MPGKTPITVLVIALIAAVLAFNNLIYYNSSKKMMLSELEEKMESIAEQVRISIDHANIGAEYVEFLMAENLRTASIAIQHALSPDVEQVSNDQLRTLRDQLRVAHITLFKRIEGDIIGYRSTDPKEINMSTNNWKYWYDAFNELLDGKPVSTSKGQTLPNFWSGPFEVSTADPRKVEKWGYYFDGTTNYLIDPYISNDYMEEYNKRVGPQAVIEKLLLANPFVTEITVFNQEMIGKSPKLSRNANNETWVQLGRRPILYGTYEFAVNGDDVRLVHEASESGSIRKAIMTARGKKVYKSFIPVTDTDIPYVIGVVSDYSIIESRLHEQYRNLALTILTATILSIIIMIVGLRFIRRHKDIAVQTTQETYIHEMNELLTAIRGQRHDFLNQVHTIHAMAKMGKLHDLQRFTSELIGDIRTVEEIIRIGNPAVAALIQAKLIVASDRKIDFTYDISYLEDVKLGVKSVDIVRILGNLIDNAFDEAAHAPTGRNVHLTLRASDGELYIRIRNDGRLLSPELLESIFEPGFTTRTEGQHSGLGLAIVKDRVRHYRGTIQASSTEEDGIVFEIRLPID